MSHPGPFKVPSTVAQDLAIIMEYVDPPQSHTNVQHQSKPEASGIFKDVGPLAAIKGDIENDDDIASTDTESEDEVEAQIALGPGSDGDGRLKRSALTIKLEESNGDSSDSESSTSSSSSASSFHRRKGTPKQEQLLTADMDLEEDGPPTSTTYIPSAHELPPTALPIPPLPDPSTLPSDPLEHIGEITIVLPDSVVVRGGGPSGSGYLSAREKRDAALDEGSLLLFDDRTVLGYVWETFGPTSLPHYVVRINRSGDDAGAKTSVSPSVPDEAAEHAQGQTVVETANSDIASVSVLEPTPRQGNGPDPSKLVISRPVYHIPSLSNFVFPSALARLKGSDASNFHDEEPADHELEFSDDEAEAAHKRLRGRSSSRAPSRAPPVAPVEEDDAKSAIGDDAGSLYGASPYDFEDISADGEHNVPMSLSSPVDRPSSSSSARFDDSATRDALMLARNSRNRRPSSASVPEAPSAAGPSQPRDTEGSVNGRGKGRERGRGKDRPRGDRGRDRNSRGEAHGRGRGRGQAHGYGISPPESNFAAPILGHDQGSSFSFEEYDPHMPRPPSPTSLAIARATGQWGDGTPFPYVGSASASISGNAQPQMNGFQSQLPMQSTGYGQAYQPQGYYDPTFYVPQNREHQSYQLQNQPSQVSPYGVAPHINPRFVQPFGLAGASHAAASAPTVPVAATQPPLLNTSDSQPELGMVSDVAPGPHLAE